MPTAVPAVDRSMLIMDLLAKTPYAPISLSDVSRGTEIHKATCAAILNTMVTHGLVSRDASRKYSLGPALVGLGWQYQSRHRAYTAGRREMWRLAERLKLSCSATIVDDEDMVILDIFGDTQPSHVPQRVGRRIPLAPPIGTIFKAWATSAEIDEWLDRMLHDFSGDRTNQLTVLSTIRSRGYSLGSELDFHVELDAALRRLNSDDRDERGLAVAMMIVDKIRNAQTADLGDDDGAVNYIVAPVFDHDGRVVMSVNLFGKPGEIRRRDIPRLSSELLKTTERITAITGGVLPVDFHVRESLASSRGPSARFIDATASRLGRA